MRDMAENSYYCSTVLVLLVVRCAPGASCTTTTHHIPLATTKGFYHRNKRIAHKSRLLTFPSASVLVTVG